MMRAILNRRYEWTDRKRNSGTAYLELECGHTIERKAADVKPTQIKTRCRACAKRRLTGELVEGSPEAKRQFRQEHALPDWAGGSIK